MKRTISSVLALAMVAGLLAVFAGAASAEVTEPSGQVAVINGASTDPVSVAIGAESLIDIAYAADAAATIVLAGDYDVAFTGGTVDSAVKTTVGGMSAQTVVSGYGDDTATAKAYPVDMTPIDAGMAKVTVWNATDAPVQVAVGADAAVEVAPGEGLPTQTVAADTAVVVDIGGVTKDVATPADSYTDVFAVTDGTTPAIAQAIIASMTDLIAALTPAPGSVAVPDVVGLTEAEATKKITDANLVAATTKAPDETITAGNVVSQDPAKDTEVEANSTVNIVVSTGSEEPVTVPVPDVSGMSAADAQTKLEAEGFGVTTEERDSETVEAGLVIETNPSAGTEVAAWSDVKMIVSTGFGDIVVPDFTGMTQDEATKAAEDAALTIKFVEDTDNPDPEGVVVSQDPTGGTTVEAGTEVVAQLSPSADAVTVQVEEESGGTPVWVWIVLGLVVAGIIALGIKMFGGGDTADGDDTTGTDTPTTETN